MNKALIINNPFFRLLAPLFTGVFAYLLIILLNNDLSSLPLIFKGQEVYVCIGINYFLFESLRLLIFNLHYHRAGLNTTSIFVQLFISLLLSLLITTGAISVYFQWALGFSVSDSQVIIFNVSYAIISILYNLLFISNFYFFEQNVGQLKYEEGLKEDIAKNIIAYRNKVNPQLLYHSLETLITLVHKNADEAEDFVDPLSAVYRHILSNRHNDLVPLKEELIAAKHIIYLLNYEFNNLIYFKNDVSDTADIMIIPGTLTVLLEQVARNNIITAISPLKIELTEEPEDGYIILKNNLNERLYNDSHYTKLLEELQAAFYYYSEKPIVQVKAHRDNFLKLPLLRETTLEEAVK